MSMFIVPQWPRTDAVVPRRIECGDVPVRVTAARFGGGAAAGELHLMAEPARYADAATQLEWLGRAYAAALRSLDADASSAVVRRLFCSDPVNQADALAGHPLADRSACAVSIVGQPPIGPAKVALWAYHVIDPAGPLDKRVDGSTLALRRGGLTHHWTAGRASPDGAGSAEQTRMLLEAFDADLGAAGMTLADHTVRTWFFVRDIDVNYRGLVEARRAHFERRGLTAATHYIASSGIGGTSVDPRATVVLDAWSVAGLQTGQVRYIKAADHLSPTSVYGVTFERAAAVDYRDRRHVLISGTASIDAAGRIVHPGDVGRQLDRTLANVDALLAEAGAARADMAHWIVYLRDASDEPLVRRRMAEAVGETPLVIVAAPVCRPGWLVEVEGVAIAPAERGDLPPF